MKILSLETSTKNFSLAVSSKGKILASEDIILKSVLSESIVPHIKAVLKKAKIKLNDVDGFAVGLGPGSFTSLRVGVATVKGLAFAVDKPVVGISSLDILAMNVNTADPLICSIVDARRSMVYACLYKKKEQILLRQSDYLLLGIGELMKKIKGPVVFIGDGISLYRQEIEKNLKEAQFAPEKIMYPQARNLAKLALDRFHQNQYDSIHKLVPIYLYPEDCQVVKK